MQRLLFKLTVLIDKLINFRQHKRQTILGYPCFILTRRTYALFKYKKGGYLKSYKESKHVMLIPMISGE